MKKFSIFGIWLALVCSFVTASVSAADAVDRAIIKQTKQLEKEGWKGLGAPVVEQIEKLYKINLQTDNEGSPIYLTSSAIAEGDNIGEAKNQSEQQALMSLSSMIKSSLIGKTSSEISSNHLKTTQTSRTISNVSIGNTMSVLSIYKKKGSGYIVKTILAIDTRNL